MIKYKNLNGNSNINSYKIADEYIDIMFNKTQNIYRYSFINPGKEEVNEMKKLAIQGYGLNSYINKYIKKRYEKIILVYLYHE